MMTKEKEIVVGIFFIHVHEIYDIFVLLNCYVVNINFGFIRFLIIKECREHYQLRLGDQDKNLLDENIYINTKKKYKKNIKKGLVIN